MDDHVRKTVAVYDSVAEQYDKETRDRGPSELRDRFIHMLPQGAMVLDAGCGPGRDAVFFSGKGFSVTGIDISDNLLEIARRKDPTVRFLHMDLRNMDFPDNMFDGIWACASLVHLKRDEIPVVLTAFHRILKPGGILFLLMIEGKKEQYVEQPSIPGHVRFYTFIEKQEGTDYLERAGFTVDRSGMYRDNKFYGTGKSLPRVYYFSHRNV